MVVMSCENDRCQPFWNLLLSFYKLNLYTVCILGVSRGPSPVSLGNQDTLPVAVALTESVNAYFKGADPTKLVK